MAEKIGTAKRVGLLDASYSHAEGGERRWRLNSSLRKCLLVLHVLSGIGWMGVDIALFSLLMNARVTSDATEAISGYTAVTLIVPIAVPPRCLGMLLTGLLLGWGTTWGLVRHWWVFVKLLLSVGMTLLVFFSLLPGIKSLPGVAHLATADAVRAKLGTAGIALMFPLFATLLHVAEIIDIKPWKCASFLRKRLSLRSRLATNRFCTSSAEVVKYIRRPRVISSWPMAQRRCVLPLPGLPKANTFSHRSSTSPSMSDLVKIATFGGSRFRLKLARAVLCRNA
jgi:hypothetical protein